VELIFFFDTTYKQGLGNWLDNDSSIDDDDDDNDKEKVDVNNRNHLNAIVVARPDCFPCLPLHRGS
jgi:hypothetical protein